MDLTMARMKRTMSWRKVKSIKPVVVQMNDSFSLCLPTRCIFIFTVPSSLLYLLLHCFLTVCKDLSRVELQKCMILPRN